MEGYATGLLKGVSIVVDRRKIGVDKGAGEFLQGGYFGGDSDGNLEKEWPGDGDIMSIS